MHSPQYDREYETQEFDKGSSLFQPIGWTNLKRARCQNLLLKLCFSCILLISNHTIFLLQFGINKHL